MLHVAARFISSQSRDRVPDCVTSVQLQVTARLGEQIPTDATAHESSKMPSLPEQALVPTPQVSNVHRRTTSTLLDWADDVAGFEGGLSDDDVPFNSMLATAESGSSINILKGLEAIAARSLDSSTSSEQAAAKALLHAARHARKQTHQHSTRSRHLQGARQRLCTLILKL